MPVYQRVTLELQPTQKSASASAVAEEDTKSNSLKSLPDLNNSITCNASDDGEHSDDDDENANANSFFGETTEGANYLQKQNKKITRGLGFSFWIAGLLNNAGYVIMIANAKAISEGAVALVFLANILPALVVKASAPYWFEKVSYGSRIVVSTALMVASFGIVATSKSLVWQLGGVACTSAQGSLGEASLLALAGKIDGDLTGLEQALASSNSSNSNEHSEEAPAAVQAHSSSSKHSKGVCLNGFSSGTGFAGVFGFFWVWFWSSWLDFSLSLTLWLAMSLAVGYLSSYRYIKHLQGQLDGMKVTIGSRRRQSKPRYPNDPDSEDNDEGFGDNEDQGLLSSNAMDAYNSDSSKATTACKTSISGVREISSMSGLERFKLVLSLWPFMVPLFTVYVAEYTLQSGTWTAIGFPVTSKKSRDKFYQYSNWLYQAGVFISRSSGSCLVAPMGVLWAMPVLQCANVAIYWNVAAHQSSHLGHSTFWSSPYFLYPSALYSGLLGGAVYIHGYLRICRDLPLEHREFALSATSLAECLGIVVADLLGLLIEACLYQLNGLDGAKWECPATGLHR